MITIIGAGPVGNYLAYLLARNNLDVSVYEEHKEIGKPVQCAGLITSEIEKFNFELEKFLIKKNNKLRLYSRNNCVELNLKKPEYIIDREKFDKYLYEKARKAGAKFYLWHKFIKIENELMLIKDIKNNKIKKIKKNILILAKGVNAKGKNYYGIQCRAKLKKDCYEVYFNVKDFFSWIIPEENNICRIGIASKDKSIKYYFENFLKKINIKNKDILNYQSGLIPIFNENIKIKNKNIYLIGDAASQVKATTGGGIIPGLYAARLLADCLINKKDYNKEISKLNKELKLHLKVRKILDKFSQEDYNYLLKLIKQSKIKRMIEEESREFPLKLLAKLLLNEPKFLKFINKLF